MNRPILLGAALMGIFLFFATYGGLTATPKFWHDEAVPFEIARNIAEFGKTDLAVAPRIFWEKSYMTHATGFPLTFPLAGIFKIFGADVAQSRVFMIAWMLAALAAFFLVMRAFFDKKTAFFSVLLVATFSSFYANGRTGTGEIPGFLFLLCALYFLYQKEWYGWGGFFAALAAVTKPSMYLFVLPVIAVELLINARQTLRKNVVKNIFSQSFFLVSGAIPVLLFWLLLINPAPFSLTSWREMIAFYQNAFNAPSLLSQFPTVIPGFFTHSTIFYFGSLLAIIIFAWQKKIFSPAQNRLVMFLFLYGTASFFYFLRSPGWFRYLLGTELLILALLPAALEKILKILNYKIHGSALYFSFFFIPIPPRNCGVSQGALQKKKNTTSSPFLLFRNSRIEMLSAFLLLGIAAFQSAQYLLGAEIPSGTKSIEIAEFINEEILAHDPGAAIGIVDYAPVAALIPANRKYQRIAVGGYDTFVGAHPLSLSPEEFPAYMLALKKDDPYQETLQRFYKPLTTAPHGVSIYKFSVK